MDYETIERSHPVFDVEHVTVWHAPNRKATVVLVHGLAEHAGRYQRTGSLLAGEGYEVIAPDLFGFGRSGGDRGDVPSWDHYFEQVERLIDETRSGRDDPVALMGHSMGGLVAASYGLSRHLQPDFFILTAPALGGGALWQKAVAPVVAAIAGRAQIPNGLRGDQLSRDPEVGESYFSDPLVLTKTSARLGNQLFKHQALVRAGLDDWSVPTLLLHGGADTVVPPSSTAAMGELPGVDRRLYPKLRHEILNEPEGPELVAEVVEWLDARVA